MNTQIITTVITGIFSILSACTAIILKNYLEQRKNIPIEKGGVTAHEDAIQTLKECSGSKYSVSRLAVIFLIAFFTGILSPYFKTFIKGSGLFNSLDTHWDALITFIFLAIVNLSVLIHHCRVRNKFSQSFYQLETILLWSSYICGWSLIYGMIWMDIISVAVGFWLIAAVVGFITLMIVKSLSKR